MFENSTLYGNQQADYPERRIFASETIETTLKT